MGSKLNELETKLDDNSQMFMQEIRFLVETLDQKHNDKYLIKDDMDQIDVKCLLYE